MDPELEQIMRRTANNMERFSAEPIDVYVDIAATAEKFILQGYGEDLAFEMAYERVINE